MVNMVFFNITVRVYLIDAKSITHCYKYFEIISENVMRTKFFLYIYGICEYNCLKSTIYNCIFIYHIRNIVNSYLIANLNSC